MGEEQEQAGAVRASVEWLQDLSKMGHELEAITLDGLEVLQARRGFFRCSFTVPSYLSDQAGNWQVGAMATMIDAVGAAAILSATGHVKASVDFNISYLATVKIQEEVVIEAKVVGDKERLTSVIVEVTRKENGELVALAKQWMASHNNAVAVAATTTKATSKL